MARQPQLQGAPYTVDRAYGVLWRWRTLMRLGGDTGLTLARRAAMRAARNAIRAKQRGYGAPGQSDHWVDRERLRECRACEPAQVRAPWSSGMQPNALITR